MDRCVDVHGREQGVEAFGDDQVGEPAGAGNTGSMRRAAEESIAQRLFSIVLAVHAAETSLDGHLGRLPAILEFIHEQSEASLEDLRRLGALR